MLHEIKRNLTFLQLTLLIPSPFRNYWDVGSVLFFLFFTLSIAFFFQELFLMFAIKFCNYYNNN